LDLDFNIAIRTIIKKNDELYLQVGGGIVHDSVEKAEFKETLDKAKSFMEILL
jgi:para-aminobenzoate synthetase component 1